MLDATLSELADAYGIEPGYHDIWGVWHENSAETARRHRTAMGVRISGAKGMGRALQAAKTQRWDRALPATLVVRRSTLAEGVTVRTAAAAPATHEWIDWRIVEEQG